MSSDLSLAVLGGWLGSRQGDQLGGGTMVHVMWAQPKVASLVLERKAEVELGCKACPPSNCGSSLRALGGITGIAMISTF